MWHLQVKSILLVFAVFIAGSAFGQDTLPEFSLKKLPNGKVVISWKNNYPVVKQISIQRSAAEKTGFKSILTLPDPTLPENGYVDATAPYDSMYYRLYILLDNGEYIFAKAKTPVLDTTSTVVEEEVKTTPDPIMSRVDSILKKQIPQKEVFKPSVYVYTSPDGNVTISLPLAYSRNYSLRFFDPETNQMIFELKKLKEVLLNLDKANFLKSGWFNFELYDGDKLIEKHKLFIPKDF